MPSGGRSQAIVDDPGRMTEPAWQRLQTALRPVAEEQVLDEMHHPAAVLTAIRPVALPTGRKSVARHAGALVDGDAGERAQPIVLALAEHRARCSRGLGGRTYKTGALVHVGR